MSELEFAKQGLELRARRAMMREIQYDVKVADGIPNNLDAGQLVTGSHATTGRGAATLYVLVHQGSSRGAEREISLSRGLKHVEKTLEGFSNGYFSKDQAMDAFGRSTTKPALV